MKTFNILHDIKDIDDDRKNEHEDEDEDEVLRKMGYKPQLHRGLSAITNLAFGFTEVAALASVCLTYGYGLRTGGPRILFWGFIIHWGFVSIVAFSMAEICAAYPSAGSVYHWAAQLVPKEYSPICSYACGALNFLGNAAGDASFASAFATFLSSSYVASGLDEIPGNQQVFVSIMILLLWSVLNVFRIDHVGWINNIAAFIHISSIFIVIISLAVAPPLHATADYALTKSYNDTGFISSNYVSLLGFTAAFFTFTGYEASAHMAEETSNSSISAPRGLINTCLATGLGGSTLLLALLFATPNVALVIDGPTGNAAAEIFVSCGNPLGAVLCWLVVINLFFAGISSVTVTARITFALCRDNAFPYSEFLKQVPDTLKSPVNAIFFVFSLDAILLLLLLDPGSGATAFASIINLCTFGFQTSYGFPILLKLIYQPKTFPKTSFDLGRWSRPFGIVSVVWLSFSTILLLCPTSFPYTKDNFNYLIVLVTGIFILMTINWYYNSQYIFTGPKQTHEVEEDKHNDDFFTEPSIDKVKSFEKEIYEIIHKRDESLQCQKEVYNILHKIDE